MVGQYGWPVSWSAQTVGQSVSRLVRSVSCLFGWLVGGWWEGSGHLPSLRRHLCQEGGVNWVDGGVTKQQSTNIAYIVVSEDNNNSNENEKLAAQPRQQLPNRGQESGR